jgi:hypothetical protein
MFLVMLLLIFLKSPALAFDENTDEDVRNLPIKERFFIGISAGLSFSSFETSVVISPSIGFRFTNRLMAGVGGTYQYFNDRSFGSVFNTHIYGWSIFSRFVVYKGFFVHGEFESLNMNSRDYQGVSPARIWENNYLLGPGYRVRMGRKSYFNLMVLYNFNTTSQIYFQNPIFRFNFEIGL